MPTAAWRQHNIEFPDRDTAQDVAVHELAPALTAAQDNRHLHGWWFIRKAPFKLRYLVDEPDSTPIADVLDKLVVDGRIAAHTTEVYEPETLAFGGGEAMDIAHALFHVDSCFLLADAAQRGAPALGQRETAVVLCSVMLRAAGLDWYEQGDVWRQVAHLRPATPIGTTPEQEARLRGGMRRLMTVNARQLCTPDGPLAHRDEWITAFERTGQALAHLARHGQLRRGLRAVLAHHVIFHTNRAAVSMKDQSRLVQVALATVFTADGDSMSVSVIPPTHTKVNDVTTLSDDRPALSADQFREKLINRLCERKTIRTPNIEAAMRSVPRESFVPDVPLDRAYADDAVYTKWDAAGTDISALSQPTIVAMMLEQLAPQPGENIMEAGAGTGYNAGLLAAAVGDTGHVTTIDVDQDLTDRAREHLTNAGITNVEVILGDGTLGHPDSAPYDKVMATVGAYEVPAAWLQQLHPGGRLVVPLRLRGTNSRSIAFERGTDGWHSVDSQLAVFMPLRGIRDDARRTVPLTPEADVTLQVHKDQTVDGLALAGVLDTERHEHWTEVLFPAEVPYEWMDLWLSCTLDNALMRMSVQSSAVERGPVTPMFGWGSMATVRGSDLAYLTTRPAQPAADGNKLYEVGLIGHGPAGHDLAAQAAEQVRHWNEHYRAKIVDFTIPDTLPDADPTHGRFILPRSENSLVVTWK